MKWQYTTMIVKDMEASVAFYQENLGFEIDSQYHPNSNTVITLLKQPGNDHMLELIQSKIHPVGLYSLGMDVENLEETLEKLKKQGASITMEPVKTLVGRMAFAEDPNGVHLAMIQHDHKNT